MSPLSRADITVIFESIHRRIKARGQDLLEIEENSRNLEHLMYTVRFSHRTVRDFLLKPHMLKRLGSWVSAHYNARTSLCKATLAITKSSSSSTVIMDSWQMGGQVEAQLWWKHVGEFFTYAHLIQESKARLDNALIEEFQRVSCSFREHKKHDTWWLSLLDYSALAFDHFICPVDERVRWPLIVSPSYDKDMTTLFLALAVTANLTYYIEHKLAAKPSLIRRSIAQKPILDRALRPLPTPWWSCAIDPAMVHLLLACGASPNERVTVGESDFVWTIVWMLFLQGLHEDKSRKARKPSIEIQNELQATRLMIEYGAAADTRPWRILATRDSFSDPMLTPSDIFHEVFPPHDALSLDQLLREHRPWPLQQIWSWLTRNVLLWFYRDIKISVWLVNSLSPLLFNSFFGVILPMVIIPVLAYLIWLAWPFVSYVLSSTGPLVLMIMLWSDRAPFHKSIVWCHSKQITFIRFARKKFG